MLIYINKVIKIHILYIVVAFHHLVLPPLFPFPQESSVLLYSAGCLPIWDQFLLNKSIINQSIQCILFHCATIFSSVPPTHKCAARSSCPIAYLPVPFSLAVVNKTRGLIPHCICNNDAAGLRNASVGDRGC
jgi:hypothetical protein